MRKKLSMFLKVGAGLAAFAGLAVVVGTFALKRYLPPEKVRALIMDNSRKLIHREVRLKSLELTVLKGLEITGLEISESPDFKAGTFAQADSFLLRVQLLPLLHATVAVDRVALGGLRLTIKKGEDGLYNFSDLAGSTAAAKEPLATPAKALPFLLDIRHASLADGKVSYRDAGTGDQLDVSEISAQLSDLSLSGDTQAEFSFKAAGKVAKKPVHASVSFSGDIDPALLNLDKVSLSMKKAVVEVPEGKLQVSGAVKGLRAPVVDLKTEVTLKGLEPITADIAGKLSELASQAPSASLSVKAHSPNLRSGDFKAFGAPEGLNLSPADIDMKFDLAGELLTLRSLNLKTKGLSADISGTIDRLRTAPVPALTVAAKLDVPALKTADLAFLQAFKVKVPDNLSLPSFKVDAGLKLAADDATLDKLHLETSVGHIDVSGAVHGLKSGTPAPDLTVSAKLNLPASNTSELSFLKQLPKNLPLPAAEIAADLRFTGDDLELRSLRLKTQAGTVEVSGMVGGLKAGKPEPDLTVAAKLKVPALGAPDLAFLKDFKVSVPANLTTPATEVDSQFHFQGDQLDIKALHLGFQQGTVDASGTVRKIKSGKPEPDLSVSARLHTPRLGPAELAILKSFKVEIPPEVTVAAADIETEFRVRTDAVEVKSFHLKYQDSVIDASGKVSGLSSGPFEPSFDIAANLKIPDLKAADLALLKLFKVEVPAELTLPATSVEAKMHYTPAELSVSSFLLRNKWAEAKASGSARKLRSGKPEGSVDGTVILHIPQVTARDLAVLKLIPALKIPDSLSWPQSEADAQFSFNGVDLDLKKFTVKNSLVDIEARGEVRKLLTAPEPRLDLKAKTDFPAFTSADIAFVPGVPPNLKIPASHLEIALRADPDKISVKALDLHTLSDLNALSVTESGIGGFRTDNPFIVLHIDGKFDLSELKKFAPESQTVSGLTGSGSLSNLSLTGHLPKGQKPNVGLNGKLGFTGLGATVAGLSLSDFAGNFVFDDKSHMVNSGGISGKIAQGALKMDLTVKNFNTPVGELGVEIQKATLTQFDVGAFLAAKASFSGAPAADKTAPAVGSVEIQPFSFKVFEGLSVGSLVHPYAVVNNANLKCELTGITPDFRKLNGTAHFTVGGGHLLDLDQIAKQFPLFKVLAIPILVLRGIGIFPNLRDIGFYGLTGDYKIADGLVVINEFHLDGDKLQVRMNSGQVDLVHDKVNLDVSVKAGNLPTMTKVICGSISKPDKICAEGEMKKAVDKTVGKAADAVQEGAKKLLDNLFKK